MVSILVGARQHKEEAPIQEGVCNQVILFCICPFHVFRSPFCCHYSSGHVGTVQVTTFYVADWRKGDVGFRYNIYCKAVC